MKNADIIILAGQSNAVGVGYTKYLSDHFSDGKTAEYLRGYPDVRIRYFSHDKKSDGFVPVTVNCTEKSKDTFGPELGMAELLREKAPDRNIFIVKCAFGGMSLFRDWISPSGGEHYDPAAYADQYPDMIESVFGGKPVRPGWCYNELVKLLQESIAALETDGYEPRIRAFCWMQGESDAEAVAEHTTLYEGRYAALVKDLCAAFPDRMQNCAFLDAGISSLWKYHRELNAAKLHYAQTHPDCVYIDTIAAGLTTHREPVEAPDTYHYDADSVIRLGHLFAQHIRL